MAAPTSIAHTTLLNSTSSTTSGWNGSATIPAGTMIAFMVIANDSGRYPTTCTLAGQAMTLAGESPFGPQNKVTIYYMTNPPSGNQSGQVLLNLTGRLYVGLVTMAQSSGQRDNGYAVVNPGGPSNGLTVNINNTLPDMVMLGCGCCDTQAISLPGAMTSLFSAANTLRVVTGYQILSQSQSNSYNFNLAGSPTYGAVAAVVGAAGVYGQQFQILGFPGL